MANHLIGFLGGTFDPIHFGHLNLALEIAERKGLDKVLFCPAKISPFKQDAPASVSTDHRLKMVEMAIAPIKGFELSDIELKREGPSYTIDTIRTLQEENPGAEYHLILGGDVATTLLQWKEAAALLKLAPPYIGKRPGSEVSIPGLEVGEVTIPGFDISSTALRERLKAGLYCGHLIPQPVLDYICSHRLYSSVDGAK
ncbi:MAG: Nicotinate-nucleotide adenylyltransferase [Chlamydiae bacterium]|nr:Nicotinate-nucleotide adenylyltransferase [Chlamydiota bacterium]